MKVVFDNWKVVGTLAMVSFMWLVFCLYNAVVGKSRKLQEVLKRQGISGPPQRVMLGNIPEIRKARISSNASKAVAGEKPIHHDCAAAIFPFLLQWRKQFGESFVFALGNMQIVCVTQPDMVREITTCTSLDLGRASYLRKEMGPLVGQGIVVSNGTSWAQQRKIIAPEFHVDKVKGMLSLVHISAMTLIESWKTLVDGARGVAEINIDEHMRSFSGDVISKVCFGSNYDKGSNIFDKLNTIQKAISKKVLSGGVPGMRYLPTKQNRDLWSLEKETHILILNHVKARMQVAAPEKDLLQKILHMAKNSGLSQGAIDHFISDNCKNIYHAAYDDPAIALTWSLMLLAANPDWQDRVRSEALQVCGGDQAPNWDMLRNMKQLTMVIHESLRLYPPVPLVAREVLKDMKFGGLNVPKGVTTWTFLLALHTDPEIWGPDSYNFNPERFRNGITSACKVPHVYMPFGFGPRICLGKNLAMIELKMLLSLIICNFSFTLSPKYVHSPVFQMVVKPEFGVHLLVKKL